MAEQPVATDLLETTYNALGLESGRLLRASDGPTGPDDSNWERVGDWLITAERMGADRLFFVGDDPVLVFAAMPTGSTERDILRMYRRAWSLARPKCLFVASLGELRVYDLTEPPPLTRDDWERFRPLEVVRETAEVAAQLAAFDVTRLESGTTFGADAESNSRRQSVDEQLVNDVREAVRQLVEGGLDYSLAHLLVQRTILVRYLEDRGVITPNYISTIIGHEPNYSHLTVSEALEVPQPFVASLSDKNDTYEIFRALSNEFNGDLFAFSSDELKRVQPHHLELLQRMLLGDVGHQSPLFLWAYDFSVVPTNLISSMYEQFYQESLTGEDKSGGTHYTPVELAEFVLGRILTDSRLRDRPRVCDPACGSGVFLVEAYKAMVRFESSRAGRKLTGSELRRILLKRIAGIDINPEAVRLAAFGLYLAFLNYQSPQDIRSSGPLPTLIARPGLKSPVLHVQDAFAPLATDQAQGLPHSGSSLPWPAGHFDVVIGNPPWDKPQSPARSLAERWASLRGLPVGERSRSQLFLWRATELLRKGGTCGLLVHESTILGKRSGTVQFRQTLLRQITLLEVVNFAPSRRLFFNGAIAPFVLLAFDNVPPASPGLDVNYVVVRPTPAMRATGLIAYGRMDRRQVTQQSLAARDYLWKVYCWGGHHDDALMSRLDLETSLRDYLDPTSPPGYGYQRGAGRQARVPSDAISKLPNLRRFLPWGPLVASDFEEPPPRVKRDPDPRLYEGQRLIVRRGVAAGWGPYTRFVTEPLAFRHTIYSIPLSHIPSWQALTIAGIALSSLGRYRTFMLSGSWGSWYDQTVSGDVLDIPVRMPNRREAKRIADLVTSIQEWVPARPIKGSASTRPAALLTELDAAVYRLFELSSSERDLIQDWLHNRLALTQGRDERIHVSPKMRRGGLIDDTEAAGPVADYLHLLLSNWNANLAPSGQMAWRLMHDESNSYLAVLLETQAEGTSVSQDIDMSDAWRGALSIASRNHNRAESSRNVLAQGTTRAVGDTYVLIMKPAYTGLWSRAAAREDYEATLLQAMNLSAS